jgi:hypothetical protein
MSCLNLPVVGEVQIGDDILVRHGYEYDPVIGPDIGRSELRTRVHHGIERFFGIWLRLPLQHFYNLPNRLAFWLFHKAALLTFAKAEFVQRITGDDSGVKAAKLESEYWLLAQLGDPGGLFRPVREAALKGGSQAARLRAQPPARGGAPGPRAPVREHRLLDLQHRHGAAHRRLQAAL